MGYDTDISKMTNKYFNQNPSTNYTPKDLEEKIREFGSLFDGKDNTGIKFDANTEMGLDDFIDFTAKHSGKSEDEVRDIATLMFDIFDYEGIKDEYGNETGDQKITLDELGSFVGYNKTLKGTSLNNLATIQLKEDIADSDLNNKKTEFQKLWEARVGEDGDISNEDATKLAKILDEYINELKALGIEDKDIDAKLQELFTSDDENSIDKIQSVIEYIKSKIPTHVQTIEDGKINVDGITFGQEKTEDTSTD